MKKKTLLLFVVIITNVILLTGCIPGDDTYTTSNPAGFFWGVWHGWIAPFSLVVGLFNKNIRVYEVINTGWWYDWVFIWRLLVDSVACLYFVKRVLKTVKNNVYSRWEKDM